MSGRKRARSGEGKEAASPGQAEKKARPNGWGLGEGEEEEEVDYNAVLGLGPPRASEGKRDTSRLSEGPGHVPESQLTGPGPLSLASSLSLGGEAGQGEASAAMDDGDDDDDEEEDDAAVDPEAAALLEEHLNPVSTFAKSGIISQIELRNFMCHRHFTISLGPNFNVITGQNGSGKSAIFVAIQVALGARAQDTKRGGNMADLITDRQTEGSVAVTLMNEGPDAIKPHVYGKRVTVKRIIKKTAAAADGEGKAGGARATSSYQVLAADGKRVSTKSKDVQEIVSHFNIQINNPVVMMNQDMAKEFFTAKDDRTLYRVFEQGTLLDNIRDELDRSEANAKQAAADLDRHREKSKGLEEKMRKDAARLEEAQRVLDDKKQKDILTARRCWAYYHQHVADHAKIMKDLKKHFDKVEGIDEELQRIQAVQGSFDQRHAELKAELRECGTRTQQLRAEMDALSDQLKEARKDEKDTTGRITSYLKRVKGAMTQRDKAVKAIEKRKEEAKRDFAAEEKKRDDQVRALEEQRQTLQSRVAELEGVAREHRDRVGVAERALAAAQDELGRARNLAADAKGNLEQARRQKDKGTALSNYGSDAERIAAAIAREAKEFSCPPMGPLGLYIKMRQDVPRGFEGAVESALNGAQRSYLVATQEDRARLTAIFRRTIRGRHPTILVQGPSSNAYAPTALDTPYRTVYSSLAFTHPWVHNAVVNQSKPEFSLLAAEVKDAQAAVRCHPQVRQAVMPDGSRATSKGGSIALHAVRGSLPPRVIFTDDSHKEAEIKYLEGQLGQAQEDVAKAQYVVSQRQNELHAVRGSFVDPEGELRGLRKQIATISTHIERANRSFVRPNTDTSGLEEDVRQAEVEAAEYQGRAEEEGKRLEEIQERVAKLQEDEAMVKGRVDLAKRAAREAEEKVSSLVEEKAMAGVQLAKLEEKRNKHQSTIDELDGRREKVEEMAAKLLEVAKERDPEEREKEVRETPEQLDRLIRAIETRIRMEEQRLGASLHELRARASESQKLYHESMRQVNRALHNHLKLETAVRVRQAEWKQIRKQLGVMTRHLFIDFMHRRGHSADIRFNHKGKELQLSIRPNAGNAEAPDEKTDTRQLSGGERAYSSLSFVMALSASVQSSLTIVDEPDVFMDSVNRRIALEDLFTLATYRKDRQFILITPQDVRGLVAKAQEGADVIKVHQLEAPDRRQGVLNVRRGAAQDDDEEGDAEEDEG